MGGGRPRTPIRFVVPDSIASLVSNHGARQELRFMSEGPETQKDRIALFIPSMAGGGAQRVFATLGNTLVDRGYHVDLVMGTASGEFMDDIQPGVSVVDLRSSRIIYAVPRLVRYLREARPIAMLSTLPHANLAAVTARLVARVPTRVLVREANTPSLALGRDLRSRILAALLPLCYRMADGVVAVSKGVADEVLSLSKLDSSRVHVIPNPVDIADIQREAARDPGHPWFAPGEPPVILGAGRLIPQKDFGTLVRAFKKVHIARESRLVILGDGPQRTAIEKLGDSLGIGDAIDLPGFVPNPFAFMARARVFALSSAWEGLPNVLIQALACGCPSVSTDCPNGPAEILRNGQDGILVPVGDPQALARAISHTLAHEPDRERLKRRAADFAVGEVVGHYARLFTGESP